MAGGETNDAGNLDRATVVGHKPDPALAFIHRQLRFTFDLGTGTYGDGKSTRLVLEGLRAFVEINKGGTEAVSICIARLYGLKLADMNKLASLGVPYGQVRMNYLTVEAGDSIQGMAVVFYGLVEVGNVEASDAPEFAFTVQAKVQLIGKVQPHTPSSYPDTAKVATVVASLAEAMDYNFENNGVTATVQNHYMVGSITDQIKEVCDAASVEREIDDVNSVVAIWPKGSYRSAKNQTVPIISSNTNQIGYPTYWKAGIEIFCRFDPKISIGILVKVQDSTLEQVNDSYRVLSLGHQLSCNAPQGAWYTKLKLLKNGQYSTLY
jgi:hypothetical protein